MHLQRGPGMVKGSLSLEEDRGMQAERQIGMQFRDSLRELESKKQSLKDQERDLNRDIYQMAQTYQRKVDEFDVLLSEYSKESSSIDS